MSLTYSYNLAGRMTAEKTNGTTTSYSYDSANQLTAAGATTYAYDSAGNRTSDGSSPSAGNQISQDANATYAYDADGNRVGQTSKSDGSYWVYSYNAADQMTVAEHFDSGGDVLSQVTYVYDAWGNLIEHDDYENPALEVGGGGEDAMGALGGFGPDIGIDIGETITRYGQDGWKVSQDFWGNRQPVTGLANFDVWVELNASSGSNVLATRRFYGDGVDTPTARINYTSGTGAVAWYFQDARGSVRAVANGSGTVEVTANYDGYGNASIGSGSANPAYLDAYRYDGRPLDAITNLQNNRDRWYDPRTGTFTEQDPAGFAAGDYNLSRYTGNDPTDFADPSGLSAAASSSLTSMPYDQSSPGPSATLLPQKIPPVMPGTLTPAGNWGGPMQWGDNGPNAEFAGAGSPLLPQPIDTTIPGDTGPWQNPSGNANLGDNGPNAELTGITLPQTVSFSLPGEWHSTSSTSSPWLIADDGGDGPGADEAAVADAWAAIQEQLTSNGGQAPPTPLPTPPSVLLPQPITISLPGELAPPVIWGGPAIAGLPGADATTADISEVYRPAPFSPFGPARGFDATLPYWGGGAKPPSGHFFPPGFGHIFVRVEETEASPPVDAVRIVGKPNPPRRSSGDIDGLDQMIGRDGVLSPGSIHGIPTVVSNTIADAGNQALNGIVATEKAVNPFTQAPDTNPNSIGGTSFVGGLIPVYGPIRNAINDAQNGRWGSAIFNGTIGLLELGAAGRATRAGVGAILEGETETLSCFTAGTPVATAEGMRPIELISRGDQVWAFDLVKSAWRLCRVTKPYSIAYKGTLVLVTIAGETTEATYQHPYWVVRGEALALRPCPEHLAEVPKDATMPGRWVDSSDLRVGDDVLLRDGRIVPVDRIVHRQFDGRVYNMEVEELRCYTVGKNSVLVHNANGPGNGPVYEGSGKHGGEVRGTTKGVSSPAPSNGQAALDNSIQVKPTSPRRIGVDRATGEIVVFDQTSPGVFHGWVPGWDNLHQDMQRALIKAGMVTQKGKVK